MAFLKTVFVFNETEWISRAHLGTGGWRKYTCGKSLTRWCIEERSKHDSVIQQRSRSFAAPLFRRCRKKRRFICRFSATSRGMLWSRNRPASNYASDFPQDGDHYRSAPIQWFRFFFLSNVRSSVAPKRVAQHFTQIESHRSSRLVDKTWSIIEISR